MHYELYLDSLFLLNFGMNLLLLCLVDHSMGHTATWYRLLAGAVVGAVWYLFPFLWKGTAAPNNFTTSKWKKPRMKRAWAIVSV